MNTQYEHSEQNQNNDLFQDYLDSLEEEQPEPHLSDQVEKDLLDYKKKGYSETVKETPRHRKNRSAMAAVAAGTLALFLAMGLTVGLMVENRSNSYAEQVYYDYDEEVYDYEDSYEEAYAQLSGDLNQPEIIVNNQYVKLPMLMQDFMQEDWQIRTSVFDSNAETVGSDPIALSIEDEWGYDIAEISIVSPTGEEVSINDALIIGISVSDNDYWGEINGGIGTSSSSWYIEDVLNEQNIEWVKRGNEMGTRYIIESDAENDYGYDRYVLRLELEDDYVERIVLQMSQSE